MQTWKTIGCTAAIMLAALFLFTTCDDNAVTPDIKPPAFEIHEWGVMVGCSADSSYFLTSRPEMVHQVDIPVIYVHSKNKTPFTAEVVFNSGIPTDTYPEAEVDSNTILWENVDFADSLLATAARAQGDHIPLEYIIDILNDVDADCLLYDSQTTRFLFYEGQVPFRNMVVAAHNLESEEATFENNSTYPLFNLLLAVTKSDDSILGPDIYIAHVEQLSPGAQVIVDLLQLVTLDLAPDLVSQGFTQKEAEAFARLWAEPFLYPTLTGSSRSNLLYRLPQDEYDNLIALNIEPRPDRFVRSLYILVHLNE